MIASDSMTDLKKTRLVGFFGEEGAKLILQHIDNLEEIFGSASVVINMVMEGKTLKHTVDE